MVERQTIDVPLKPGARLTLIEDIDLEANGKSGTIMYESIVDKYVPDTGLLLMEDGTQRTEVGRMIDEAEAIEIIKDGEVDE